MFGPNLRDFGKGINLFQVDSARALIPCPMSHYVVRRARDECFPGAGTKPGLSPIPMADKINGKYGNGMRGQVKPVQGSGGVLAKRIVDKLKESAAIQSFTMSS